MMDVCLPCVREIEGAIVRHCAPTLAGLKPANLFVYREHTQASSARDATRKAIGTCRARLAPLGVRIEILARRKAGPLVYVYRPTQVSRTLADDAIASYLRGIGYDPADLNACITLLHRRICGTDVRSLVEGSCRFPHEIGFFLGYPYDDVVGFIENKGRESLCTGCWKVYAHESDARECFCRFKNCTARFKQLYEEGASLEELAATGIAC